jgi:hypothetical protein
VLQRVQKPTGQVTPLRSVHERVLWARLSQRAQTAWSVRCAVSREGHPAARWWHRGGGSHDVG